MLAAGGRSAAESPASVRLPSRACRLARPLTTLLAGAGGAAAGLSEHVLCASPDHPSHTGSQGATSCLLSPAAPLVPGRRPRASTTSRSRSGKTLPLPCVSTAFVAKGSAFFLPQRIVLADGWNRSRGRRRGRSGGEAGLQPREGARRCGAEGGAGCARASAPAATRSHRDAGAHRHTDIHALSRMLYCPGGWQLRAAGLDTAGR